MPGCIAKMNISIIPARMASSRFPGKPLALIRGVPMVEHCFRRSVSVFGASNTYVATCDQEICNFMESIGGQAIMTSAEHKRAVSRTAEAAKIINGQRNFSGVVMIQGDEPLTDPAWLSNLDELIKKDPESIHNVAIKVSDKQKFEDRDNVKVVTNTDGEALYFSRCPIPFTNELNKECFGLIQTGLMAFPKKQLFGFDEIPEGVLEIAESVDLNRVIEAGGKIKICCVDGKSFGVDNLDDLAKAEDLMIDDVFFRSVNKSD